MGNGRGVAPVEAHAQQALATMMSSARIGFGRIIG
jgi:hypothetical protein